MFAGEGERCTAIDIALHFCLDLSHDNRKCGSLSVFVRGWNERGWKQELIQYYFIRISAKVSFPLHRDKIRFGSIHLDITTL